MRPVTRMASSLPHYGGAHSAPARERREAKGAPRAAAYALKALRRVLAVAFGGGGTEPGCGAVPHIS
jgi:hypothetical protein